MTFIIQIAVAVLMFYLIYRVIAGKTIPLSNPFSGKSNPFSDSKQCPRCEGKGWWQNTRNREKCEWCGGTGKVPRDFPLS